MLESREVSAKIILGGPRFSNDDVIMAMTSLLPPYLQNIGGAAAPPAPPPNTSLSSGHVPEVKRTQNNFLFLWCQY